MVEIHRRRIPYMAVLRQELISFIAALNSQHETIKFTSDISDININFLDVTVTKDK